MGWKERYTHEMGVSFRGIKNIPLDEDGKERKKVLKGTPIKIWIPEWGLENKGI